MTKLSEKLAKLADAGGTLGPVYGVMADDARAIEERAENAEAQLEYVRATVRTQEQTAQELEERAQTAEAKLKWHEETQRTYYDVEARAAAAEAEVARLRARIEALAANRMLGSDGYLVTADVLRALLKPAKPETALDAVETMVSGFASGEPIDVPHGTWFWMEDKHGNKIRIIVDADQPKGVAYYSASAVSVPVETTEDELRKLIKATFPLS